MTSASSLSLVARGLFTIALPALAACGGDRETGDALNGGEAQARSGLSPSCGLDTSGSLQISTQAELDALAGCTAVEGSLSLASGSLDLRPLSQLQRVGGTLAIGCDPHAGLEADCSGQPQLTASSLEGLNAEEVGRLQLARLDVASLAPLARLRRVGFLRISSSQGFRDLSGLGQLEQLEQLELAHNADLESLDGLAASASLGSVLLEVNPALGDISALAGFGKL